MPELSPDEQFQKVLAAAASQLREGKILIRFGPQGKMRFIINEAGLKDALPASGLGENSFRTTFNNEIGPLLEGVVRGRLDDAIRMSPFLADVSDPKTHASRTATLTERARAVEKALVTSEIRGRYVIKANSQHPRLRVHSWEVLRKLDLSTKEPWLQPYATLSFETIRPETQLGILSWFPFFPTESIGRTENCTFDCDEGDLDDLIESLKQAKAALCETKKKVEGEGIKNG